MTQAFGIGSKMGEVAMSEVGNDCRRSSFSEWMGVRAEGGISSPETE